MPGSCQGTDSPPTLLLGRQASSHLPGRVTDVNVRRQSSQFLSQVFRSSLYAPIRNIHVKNRINPWFNGKIQETVYYREYIRRKAVRLKDEHLWNEYKKCRNYVNNLIKKTKKEYYENEINASRTNAKHMWQTLKQIIPSKSKSNAVPSELEAKQFNEYFSTIGNDINAHFGSDITLPSLNNFTESSFEFITSNVDFVRKKL